MEERIKYEIEDRQTIIDQIFLSDRIIVNDVTIDLVAGRPTTCYFEVVAILELTEIEDMQAALTLLEVDPMEV